ncbi:Clp protease ClpP [Shewanella sp. KX20019]|uniref:head maturation protease, ClpP-related n=1 Tax=Shewanella sp. KX20019 TaxID=2803864 RepID=UPI00192821F7|nr:head maturation protease, ClpP-related [Shewanella sp. KX20019]QQX80853.1 Clp protease ClpP [Shewanella sp. KX20019]
MPSWYSIQNKAGKAKIEIYDEIGLWGISAKDFSQDLKALDPSIPLDIHINSPGGSVFDGLAIYNMIKAWGGETTAYIDGMAASMASVIAVATNKTIMPENAFMMIHNPWGFAAGDADEMRDYADFLDKMKGSLVSSYTKKSNATEEQITELMNAETWLTGTEALELGLADELTDKAEFKACSGLEKKFKSIPESLSSIQEEEIHEEEIEEKPIEEQAPKGFSRSEITEMIADAIVQANGKPKAEEPVKEENSDYERSEQISQICRALGFDELAADYIKSDLSVDQVRAKIFEEANKQTEIFSQSSPKDLGESPLIAAVNKAHNLEK